MTPGYCWVPHAHGCLWPGEFLSLWAAFETCKCWWQHLIFMASLTGPPAVQDLLMPLHPSFSTTTLSLSPPVEQQGLLQPILPAKTPFSWKQYSCVWEFFSIVGFGVVLVHSCEIIYKIVSQRNPVLPPGAHWEKGPKMQAHTLLSLMEWSLSGQSL